MKKKALVKVCMLLAACLVFAATAYAETTTSYGINFRLRQETWDNLFDMNVSDVVSGAPFAVRDENYYRLKTSPWFKVDIDKKYGFYAKLTNEARYFMDSNTSSAVGMNKDEIVFDNLYVSANGFLGMPVDLTVGRQDFLMTYGEGFLIMDGTPGDGSRTFYFNAAKGAVKLSDQYGLDLVYLFTQKNDRALPSLYSSPKRTLNTSDEEGLVAYGRGKISENLTVEPYYIFKNEETGGADGQLDLNTVGARAVYAMSGGWKLRGEYARQFGNYDSGRDREGDGGYVYLGRKYEDLASKPSFELGYVYLSGDDPDTAKVEAWDPLFSRWPWLSELYVLSYARETGIVGYWTNLQLYRASFKFGLDPETGLELSYNYLRANENLGGSSIFPGTAGLYSIDGKTRGHLIQAKLSHKFSKTVDGYVLIEDFVPGDYYADTNQDNAMFVRWELQWKI